MTNEGNSGCGCGGCLMKVVLAVVVIVALIVAAAQLDLMPDACERWDRAVASQGDAATRDPAALRDLSVCVQTR